MDLWAWVGRPGGASPVFSCPSVSQAPKGTSRWTAEAAAPASLWFGASKIARLQHWLQGFGLPFSPCLLEELNQLAQLKMWDLLKAESLVPPVLPGASGSVNSELALLKQESLKGVWIQETFHTSCRCSGVEIYHLCHCSQKGVSWTELEHRFSAAKGQD